MTNTRYSIVERPGERGSALVGVLLLLMMMSALAAALGVSGQTETLISQNEQSGAQAQAAAEAGLNHAVELAITYIAEWHDNGFASVNTAIGALLLGPDLASGTVDTDADNGSLGTRAGITAAEDIPLGTRLTIAAGINAEYEAFIMDDEDNAPDEDGNPLTDGNQTLIIRATGYARDNTKVVLEVLISPLSLPAILVNGDLEMSGSVAIDGEEGSVHTNGDLNISGSVDVSGTVSASGEYTGPIGGIEGAPEIPVPDIYASDYLDHADFILTSSGTMTDLAGTVLCAADPCNNWSFDSGTGEWSIGSAPPADGTYYVEGSVKITGSPGSAKNPVQISIIAEGSIDISGSPDIVPDSPELLFVTDGDLEISGGLDTGDPLTTQGQVLVHEQVKISGNPALGGQLIVQNATSVSTLVTSNEISGNMDIVYNGGLGSGTFTVSGWRDVRDDD